MAPVTAGRAPGSPPAVPEDPADPRRVLVADLVGQLWGALAGLAGHYEAAGALANGTLGPALRALAGRKGEQLAALGPLAERLGARPASQAGEGARAERRWGVLLGHAFEAERTLETAARQLAVLTTDPAIRGLAARLAAGALEDREAVRKLYLRYT
jgi:hypothetical protein